MAQDAKYVPALRFNWLTPFYDALTSRGIREDAIRQRQVDLTGLQPGHSVLDLGSGTGTMTVLLKKTQPDAQVFGIDGDPAMVEQARQKVKGLAMDVHYDLGMVYDMPYESQSMDRIVSTLVFHHLTPGDKVRALHEAYRVMKPGGELHIADWGKPSSKWMRLCHYSVQFLDGFETTTDNVEGRLPSMMEECGFRSAQQSGHSNTLFGTLCFYQGTKPIEG